MEAIRSLYGTEDPSLALALVLFTCTSLAQSFSPPFLVFVCQKDVPDVAAYFQHLIDVCEKVVGAVESSVLTSAECGAAYRTAQAARSSKAADRRHINQQVSIVANLQAVYVFKKTCIICHIHLANRTVCHRDVILVLQGLAGQ